ncbi:SGNH/GDSL hydrolase family protein [Pedobacter hiemivivus]|uniref:SGNH/GDSL hydrolase family protein n=1 Tax=Pedobacter hiemivivus TaxID=2530454 RepID=A0A4R0MZR4_9SPHI|nr:SGNH/GDSL hydrolase family protein [Pedobacter hiemivivus]TCC92497.1 SGNH/GDSL hydrolase family protein [Pedobacter hiemivivus]
MNHINRRQIVKYVLSTIAGTVLMNGLLRNSSFAHTAGFPSSLEGSGEPAAFEIINAGVGGNNTVDMLTRIAKDCLAHQPKLTILMVGTNDMNSVKHIPLSEYEQHLKEMVKRIKATKSKVLLMTILPCYEPDLLTRHPAAFYEPEGVSGRRKQINDVVKKIAAEHKTYLLDLEHRFLAIGKIGADRDSLIQNLANTNKRDGIHPTVNGYRFIGLTVYDFITDHKLPASGIVCFGDSITKGDGSVDKDSYPGFLSKLLNTK